MSSLELASQWHRTLHRTLIAELGRRRQSRHLSGANDAAQSDGCIIARDAHSRFDALGEDHGALAAGRESRYDRTLKLFCGNLPFGTSELELHEYFSQCGAVIEVCIRRDRNGMPSFGFIAFEREQEERAAMTALNGKPFEGRPLTVALAHRQ